MLKIREKDYNQVKNDSNVDLDSNFIFIDFGARAGIAAKGAAGGGAAPAGGAAAGGAGGAGAGAGGKATAGASGARGSEGGEIIMASFVPRELPYL